MPVSGAFVLSWRIPPPVGRTLMVRAGGTVFFASRSLWTGWVRLANGREESIEEPTWWWNDESEVAKDAQNIPEIFLPPKAPERAPRKGQLSFDFADSKVMSRRAA